MAANSLARRHPFPRNGGTPGRSTVIQTLNLPASGSVIFAVNNLAVGSGHVISAVYSGDSNFTTSTSPNQPYTVNRASTTTTLFSPATSPLVFSQGLTFTATIAAVSPGSGTPTGTVQLFDGVTQIQSQNLPSGGQVSFVIAPGLSLGNHAFSAVYSGDGNFITSTSTAQNYNVVRTRPPRR